MLQSAQSRLTAVTLNTLVADSSEPVLQNNSSAGPDDWSIVNGKQIAVSLRSCSKRLSDLAAWRLTVMNRR